MDRVVRRNTFLLALGLVFQSGMIQLAVALGTVTLVAVTGIEGILGLGPAVFLIAGALAVGPAGRLSDRVGRLPVIRGGVGPGILRPAGAGGRRGAAAVSASGSAPGRGGGPAGPPIRARSSSSASGSVAQRRRSCS